jgi:hypothetical protein
MKCYVLAKPKMDTPEDLLGGMRAIKEEDFSTGEALRCPKCNRFLTMLKWLPPYRVELERWGREFGDFADIGEDMIVSERFAQAFPNSGLKGLSAFEPVEVVRVIHHLGRPSQPLSRYFKAAVTYSPTAVDQRTSGYVWVDESKVCPVCLWGKLKRYARIVIKQETWNGDDIFYPRGGTGPMVSERFKAFFERHAFLNAVFKPADQESYDYSPWETQGSSRE